MLVVGRLDRPRRSSPSVFAAYAIERLRFTGARRYGLAIFLAYLVPPSILFIPLAVDRLQARHLRHAAAR